jgi:hypothetical protein
MLWSRFHVGANEFSFRCFSNVRRPYVPSPIPFELDYSPLPICNDKIEPTFLVPTLIPRPAPRIKAGGTMPKLFCMTRDKIGERK